MYLGYRSLIYKVVGWIKRKRGLSQTVTTLILLVVSVLLSSVVVRYATNITMTRTKQEEVSLLYTHIWVTNNNTAQAAFYIKNVGGKDILMDKITVRGIESEWTSVYYDTSAPTGDLSYRSSYTNLTQASNDIGVVSSGSLVVYIDSPDNIVLEDLGISVTLNVLTVNGQWIQEANVEYAGV